MQGERSLWVSYEGRLAQVDASACRDWDDVARAACAALSLSVPSASLCLRRGVATASPSVPDGSALRACDAVPAGFCAPREDPLVLAPRSPARQRVASIDPCAAIRAALDGALWAPQCEEGAVAVSSLKGGRALRAVARGVKTSPEEARDAFLRPDLRVKWDAFAQGLEIIQAAAEGEVSVAGVAQTTSGVYFARLRWNSPPRALGTVKQRDFSLVLWERRDPSGAIVIVASPCECHYVPADPLYERGRMNAMVFVAEPSSEEQGLCNLTYTIDVDLAGWLPLRIVDMCLFPDCVSQLQNLVSMLNK
eukprot:m51a1_g602 hypothetical protein (307) ;mRNA; r:79425-80753